MPLASRPGASLTYLEIEALDSSPESTAPRADGSGNPRAKGGESGGAARLAAVPVGESPTGRGFQLLP